MAYQFTVNQAPADGALGMWSFISLLISSGWTKTQDSDGTTYSNTGTQVTGGNSGANGLNNLRAWVVLQSPAGASSRQICIQSTFNNGLYWRIKYSRQAGFTGGSPDAQTVPSATDEAVVYGSGSDASPGTTQYFGQNTTYYMQLLADNASPYSFALITYSKVTGIVQTVFALDGLTTGTYPNGDNDPVVIYCNFSDQGLDMLSTLYFSSEASGPASWLKYGLAGAGFVKTPALYLANTSTPVVPGGLGQNAITGEDNDVPVMYARRGALSAPVGYKGMSSLFTWKGSNRGIGVTFNNKAKAIFGDVAVPWDGTTIPAL